MSLPPREPLTAEERALAAQLPRLHGSVEPDASLDGRILAAARSAVTAPPSRGPRMRWIASMAVAASLSLAVGLAWRLQPPAAAISQASMAEAAVSDQPNARFTTPQVEDAQAIDYVTPPPAAPPEQARPASPRAVADATAIPPAAEAAAASALPPPAPPAPPAASAAASSERAAASDMVAAPAVAQSSNQGMAKAARNEDSREARESAPASASAAAAPRPQSNEAARAAEAAADEPQPFLADDPGQEVPPATADSPQVRDAWLRRIGELLQQGREEDAKASLAEFRRRFPDSPLPPELRALEP